MHCNYPFHPWFIISHPIKMPIKNGLLPPCLEVLAVKRLEFSTINARRFCSEFWSCISRKGMITVDMRTVGVGGNMLEPLRSSHVASYQLVGTLFRGVLSGMCFLCVGSFRNYFCGDSVALPICFCVFLLFPASLLLRFSAFCFSCFPASLLRASKPKKHYT